MMWSILIGFALVACGGGDPAEPRDSGSGPPTTTEWEVPSDGGTLHVRVTGHKNPRLTLVAINGGPGLSHLTMEWFEDLADEDMQVVTYDQRGTGVSTAPNLVADYTMDEQVADLETIRTYLDVDTWIMVGHSFGGLLTQAYLIAHPGEVTSAVLLDATPPDLSDLVDASTRFSEHVEELQAKGLVPDELSADYCERTFQIAPAYFADPTQPLPESITNTKCSSEVADATFDDLLDGYDYRDALAAADLPVLVVFGQHDPFGVEVADQTMEAFAQTDPELLMLPDTGHFPWLEADTEAFRKSLVEFSSSF